MTFVAANVTALVSRSAVVAYKQYDQLAAGLAEAEPYLPVKAASGGPPGVIDDQFQYLVNNNSLPNRVPLWVNTMRNEGGLFIPEAPGFESPVPSTQQEYVGSLTAAAIVPNRSAKSILASGLVSITRGLSPIMWRAQLTFTQFPLNTSDPDSVRGNLVEILTSLFVTPECLT